MSDDTYSAFLQLLKDDPRYRLEAYQFVREALSYGQRLTQPGGPEAAEEAELEEELEMEDDDLELFEEDDDEEDEVEEFEEWETEEQEQHLTGQMLCEAIRDYATHQYGLMAKTVLNSWGIYTTGDFGEIVYNLIEIGMMRKSKSDRREDFDNQYEFETAFVRDFRFQKIERSRPSKE